MFDFLFGLFTWIISPEELIGLLKRAFLRHKVETSELEEKISNIGLRITNGESLRVRSYITKRSIVYFPVVPRANLSIIHIFFANVIQDLSKLGFGFKILIFDDYYRRVKKCDEFTCKTNVKNFIKQLNKMGISSFDICLESRYINRASFAKKFLSRIMDLCAIKSIDEVDDLRRRTSAFTKGTDSYIRQQKIFYNLAYVSLFKNIGLVLCGNDEVPMWEDFINLEKDVHNVQTVLSQLVILSIPKMRNSKGLETSIWDEVNIGTDETKRRITELLMANLQEDLRKRDCGVFYLLDNLFFARNKTIEIIESGTIKKISSVDRLIEEINHQTINNTPLSQEMVNQLVDCIYSILHNIGGKEK